MAYEHEQTQKEVERLRNQSPSKRQFDNTNFSSNVGFTVYNTVAGIKSIPEMWKMGKSAFNIGKSAIKNIPKYLEELENVIKEGKKVVSELESSLDDIIKELKDLFNSSKGVSKAKFKYKNNPSENPKVLINAVENPNAVYGYSPNPEPPSRIKEFASEKYDWTNPEEVAKYKKIRI